MYDKKKFKRKLKTAIGNAEKKQHVKNMVIGMQSACKLILDKINNGESLEDIKDYLEKTQCEQFMKNFIDNDK